MKAIELVSTLTSDNNIIFMDARKEKLWGGKSNKILHFFFAGSQFGQRASKCKVLSISVKQNIVGIVINKHKEEI